MNAPLSVLILAAGEGSRMKSSTPKVLHRVAGRTLLEHVLNAVSGLRPKDIAVVVGVGRDGVKDVLSQAGWKRLSYIVQSQPRGSGHAVLQARSWLRGRKGHLLVVYGDTPLLTTETLQRLIQEHAATSRAATFLAMELDNPTGYGRMIRRPDHSLAGIVEERDANARERAIHLVNSGVAVWAIGPLLAVLPQLEPDNAKQEYYLTDAVSLLRAQGERVGVFRAEDPREMLGVNTREELAQVEAVARRKILSRWMREGVTVVDPDQTYVDWNVQLAPDTRLWPGTLIRGATRIGSGCDIGPYTVIEDSVVKAGAKVGPFAHLRAGSVIEEGARIGNFVETKKARIGKGSKVNHLTYLGDASVGARVNVGAGTITCNYDGVAKHATIIEDDVFIGSNANLVAPVRIRKGALVAAGSTLTEDVPAESLAVARSRQVNKTGWVRKWRREHKRRNSHD